MAKLIHTMIRVRNLAPSLAFYHDAFGLEVAHRLDFPEFSLAYLRNAETEAELELTWNRDRNQPYTHGDGYGHVALSVADAAATRRRFEELGLSPREMREFRDQAGGLLARYFFVEDPDGYKIEVLERHGHYT
ncbi:MAG: VOC family protein [Acetobacteraceae bacterium]